MPTLLERFRNRIAAGKAETITSYRQLVEAAAADEAFDDLSALAILRAADVTPEGFAADVERYRQRQEWRRQLDEAERARAEFKDAAARHAAALEGKAEALRKIEAEYGPKIAEADDDVRRLRRVIDAGDKAASNLRGTCPPGVRAGVESIKARLSQAGRSVDAAEAEERRAVDFLAGLTRDMERQDIDGPKDVAEAVKAAERAVELARESLEQARRSKAAVAAEKEAASLAALEPWPEDCPTLRGDF